MFEPLPHPRVFGIPIGVDFAQSFVHGVRQRLLGTPPEALARVEIFVNTSRMQRRVLELFREDGALLLPNVRLITDLAKDPFFDIPPPINGLARRLDLARLT